VARLQIGESSSGIESLERSLELAPRQGLAHLALGLAFKDQKRFAAARDALQRTLQLMPGNVDALVALAEAEEGLGDLGLAEQHLRRALELAEDSPAALSDLGKNRMRQESNPEARDALRRTVEQDPRTPTAHTQLSLAYSRLDDPESSRRHVELYRRARRAEEERLIELRTAAGLGAGGPRQDG
jgi:tetratricopeptide (TPR) repeat protein